VLVSTSAAGRGKIVVSWPMRLLAPLRWLPVFQGRYPQPRYAHMRQRQATVTYDAAGRLARITVPTLILHGRRDRSVPLARAERLHAGIAGSQLRVFPGGHMFFMLAQRQQVLDQVSRFLSDEG
jgi:3-oxoadipate enol-lactonase